MCARIMVKVVPRSKEVAVEEIREGYYKVRVKEAALKGRANMGMVVALAEYFRVARSEIKIVIGKTNKEKMVEIIGVSP